MFKFFKSLLSRNGPATDASAAGLPPAPAELAIAGAPVFALFEHLSEHNSFPFLDWAAAREWVDAIPAPELQAQAWLACERGWLQHMREALGPGYRLAEESDALLLSSLAPNVARATLGFVGKTQQRIVRLLDGVARPPALGKAILIVFDDGDDYYRYVSHYYHEEGEFAVSGGMYINAGCGHFVTVKADLRMIEPVIAHELTHGSLSHLRIPAWLNEGLAVNTERRLCPPGAPLHTPRQMHEKHLQFWGAEDIQQFWSGKSFLRSDDGNLLSYDLARIIVAQLSSDWPRFRDFVLAADLADAGAQAAAEHFNIDLGAAACALLEQEITSDWSPEPGAWIEEPERGAFCPQRDPAAT